MAATLTPKQQRVLDFIRSYWRSRGCAPTQEEIAARLGFRSLGTVQNYLVRLERQGVLKRPWNAKRALEVVEPEGAVPELPLLGTVAAGRPIEAVTTPDTVEVPGSMLGRGDAFVLRVKGDSMVDDGILDGDLVVVRRQNSAENGQTVVALVDGAATVKRLYRRGGRVELRPANPAVDSLWIGAEQAFGIEGVVVGVIRHCR